MEITLFLPTIILRHRKENLKKCSLHGLEKREDLHFLTYPIDEIPFLKEGLLLDLNAPPLSAKDRGKQLFLIDGTWNYAAVMHRQIPYPDKWARRSLPGNVRTAYPRKQTGCVDPKRGLASVEALFMAHLILGYPTEGLLDHYYWKEEFLHLNSKFLLCSTTSP
jgi:pre-rRNA-processing protein TSR3